MPKRAVHPGRIPKDELDGTGCHAYGTGRKRKRNRRCRKIRTPVHDRALAWQGFSPQVSMVNEVRKTNARLHDHERTGGEPGFVR